jgi:endonuclease/exonuclease/phosphatase family metal-dependent hydrolase
VGEVGLVVRIGTWNLENLFRPGGDAGPTTDEAYQAKLAALAATITDLAPDVLAVQEVGEPEALDDLVAKLGGPWHTELAEPDGRGIRVGFLSQLALSEVEHVSAFPAKLHPVQVDDTGDPVSTMGRAALRVRVQAAGHDIGLVTCHLKSKLLTFPGGRFSTTDEGLRARFGAYALNRRAAEAATIRTYTNTVLDGHGQQRAALVLGDLNDEPEAATTQMLLGPPGSQIGTGGFDQPERGDGQRLWNLAPLIPPDQRFSRIYQGQHELIDHILASHLIANALTEGDVTTGDTSAPSIGDDPNARRDAPGSDHRPILATITL